MSRDTVEIANELLAENAMLKAQLAELTAENRNYSELLQYHIDRQAKAEAQLAALAELVPKGLSYAGIPAEYPSYTEEIAHQRGFEHCRRVILRNIE